MRYKLFFYPPYTNGRRKRRVPKTGTLGIGKSDIQPFSQQPGSLVGKLRRRGNLVQHSSVVPEPVGFILCRFDAGDDGLDLSEVHVIPPSIAG